MMLVAGTRQHCVWKKLFLELLSILLFNTIYFGIGTFVKQRASLCPSSISIALTRGSKWLQPQHHASEVALFCCSVRMEAMTLMLLHLETEPGIHCIDRTEPTIGDLSRGKRSMPVAEVEEGIGEFLQRWHFSAWNGSGVQNVGAQKAELGIFLAWSKSWIRVWQEALELRNVAKV